jgi:iron(III) transport system permease protein
MLLFSSVSSKEGLLPFEELTLTFDNYWRVLTDPLTYKLLYNTAIFTVGSMAIGISIAVFLAWVTERSSLPGRKVIYALIMIPMAIPSMVYAISWTQLLNPKTGMLNVLLQAIFGFETGPFNVYSLGGMIFVQGILIVPTAFLMIAATFSTLDPTLEEQSSICGRSLLATIRKVTVPILRPSLLSAIIFFTIVSIESFEVPGTLGLTSRIAVLSTQIYFVTHSSSGALPDYGMASALGAMLLVFAFILVWIYQRMTKNVERFATVTGKGYRPKPISLGKWKPAVVSLIWLYVILSVMLPFLTLVWASLHPFYVTPSWEALKNSSIDAYKLVLDHPGLSSIIWNTLFMSVVSGLITVLLVALIAWMVVRGPYSRRASRALDTLSFLGQAAPAVVIGLALMFFYVYLPLPIYGTIWILIIGMVTKYIAFGSRTLISSQIQISKELEEASQISGASWLKTMGRVQFPLLMPAIVNCFFWVAIHAMRELSVVIMLYSPKTLVLSTTIWNFWEGGWTAQAAVLGVFMIVLLGLIFYGSQVLITRLSSSRG